MPISSNTRTGKRKFEKEGLRKENVKGTKNHELKRLGQGKLSDKESLKTLQEKFDKLEKEIKKKDDLIQELNDAIEALRQEKVKSADQVTKESQTEYDSYELPCSECIFMASCEDELNCHNSNDHNLDEPDEHNSFSCNVCWKKNKTKGELMIHRKQQHPERTKVCSYFLEGICELTENVCWFNHDANIPITVPRTLKEYTCRFCKQIFTSKSEFMKHRKKNHPKFIAVCRDEGNGYCRFTDDECWYAHAGSNYETENTKTTETTENNSVMMDRLFSMMEKFTERMEMLESQLLN